MVAGLPSNIVIVTPGSLQGNILIDSYKKPLICDFGFSRIRHEVTRTNTDIREGGKHRFLAPELLEGASKFRTSAASDVFSLSMVYLNIWARQPPFAHLSDGFLAAEAIRRRERPSRPADDLGLPSERMKLFWALIQQMWAHEADCRPAAEDVYIQLEGIFTSLSN
jgi:serine/threonine protein kinase